MRRLTILAGYPGVGKSFVGTELANQTNAVLLETDQIRKEITNGNPTYSGDESQRTYDELFDRARTALENNNSVILDATFNLPVGRNRAEAIATDLDVPFRIVHVTCDEATTKQRIRQRTNSNSDADVAVYDKIKADFEPFDRDVIEVDNSTTKANTRTQLKQLL